MDSRDAYDQRIDPQHLAPLWTRLKSLVPAEPTPVGVPHRWAYSESRGWAALRAKINTDVWEPLVKEASISLD